MQYKSFENTSCKVWFIDNKNSPHRNAYVDQLTTCGWWAVLTLAKLNNVGSVLFEPLYPFEDIMSIQNIFHFCPLEIAASVHGRDGQSRLDWPCRIAAISEGQK